MKNKEYSVRKVLNLINHTIFFDFHTWLLSILGAFITAMPWFITILLNVFLMRMALDSVIKQKQMWKIILLIIGILIFLRIPTIV